MPPYSDLRAARFLLDVLLGSLLTSLPFFLLQSCQQRAERQREEQEQLERRLIDMDKAARQPNAGEAARRLLGIKTSPQPEQPSRSRVVIGPDRSGAPADRREKVGQATRCE